MNRKPYTPDELRELAKASGANWSREVRAALNFCADLIQAADAMRDSHEAAIKAAVAREREACAFLAEHCDELVRNSTFTGLAAAIRARGAAHE